MQVTLTKTSRINDLVEEALAGIGCVLELAAGASEAAPQSLLRYARDTSQPEPRRLRVLQLTQRQNDSGRLQRCKQQPKLKRRQSAQQPRLERLKRCGLLGKTLRKRRLASAWHAR